MIARKQAVVLAAAIGICAGGAGVVLRRGTPTSTEPRVASDTAASTDLAALKRQVDALETSLASRELRFGSLESATQPASPPPAPSAGPGAQARATPPPTAAELQERETARLKRLDDLAVNEPRDPAWAPGYEKQIENAFRSSSSGDGTPKIERLSCRTSLCRIELSSGTPELLASLHGRLPPMAAMHLSSGEGSNGSHTMTIDIVREGYPVPDVED